MIKNIIDLEELLKSCLKSFDLSINFVANFSSIENVDIQFNQLIQLKNHEMFPKFS